MTDRLGVIRRAFVLPADDLSLETLRGGRYGLGDDIAVTLSLLYGIGPNVPRLITVDDAGRLILGTSPGLIGPVQIADGTNPAQLMQLINTGGGLASNIFGPAVHAVLDVNNGVGYSRLVSASASIMQGLSSSNALEVSPPGMWSVVSTPAAGVQATATKAAGAAGVRHVATGIIITHGAIVAPVATALTWNLRDGASGAGTIIASGQIAVPAAVFQGTPIAISDITLLGTAATAMTLEFSGALANLLEGVTLTGYDCA